MRAPTNRPTMVRVFVTLTLALAVAAIPVLKFRPLAGGSNNPSYTVTLDKNENQIISFSICTRFKFNIFSSQCIFKAGKNLMLYFDEYRYKCGGNLEFADVVFTFTNDFNLEKLLNWQNVCITFDQPAKKVKLFLNSEQKLDLNITSTDQSVQLGSNFSLGNCLNQPFNGEMSDFNVWSRFVSINYLKLWKC